jgi:dCTP deaminase
MLMNDVEIRDFSRNHYMITPFEPNQVRNGGVISYGTSSFGYDARLSREFKVFTNTWGGMVDPKNFDARMLVDIPDADYCIIPPNCYVLGRTVEEFLIPRHVLAICLGKSTYARCGLIVNVTPLEPEWRGHVTLEIGNSTPLPAKVYAGEGICQFLFLKGGFPMTSYKDRDGKYQDQHEVTLPRV